MAGRTVSVAITANTSGFTAGMTKVSASAKTAAQSVKSSFDGGLSGLTGSGSVFGKIGSSLDKGLGSIGKHKQAISTLGTGLLAIGATAGIGVGLAVRSFAKFDQAMSNVAATGSDARNNLDALKKAAIDAGARTAFSASEAADGIEALAKAGVSAQDTLGGGLSGALDLAAAGGLGVADAAETAASAMNQFGLAGKDVPHIADLLAQAAGTAQGEVSDMAQALNQSGLIAHQFGLSVDETSQALALFAKNGLVGSDAGTSFKTMLTSLYAPSGTAATALDKLGVSAYDSTGAMKGIGPLADDLKAKLDSLSAEDRNNALRNIFGSDAIRAGTILLKDGSAGLANMATEFGKFGSASDVARQKMNNLNGDIEQLKGSLETAFIGLGEGANGPLRSLVQSITTGINAFNDLGDGTKQAALVVLTGIATIGLAGGGIAKVAIAASEARAAFKALGISAKAASIATVGIGAALGVAALAYGAWASSQAASKARVEDFTQALQSQTDAIQENVTKVAAKQLQDAGAFQAARGLGLSLDTVTQAALGNTKAMDAVRVATEAAFNAGVNSNDVDVLQRVDDAQVLAQAVGKTGSEYNTAMQAARDFASATDGAGAAANAAGDAAQAHADAVQAEAQALQDVITAAYATSDALLQLSGSQIGVESAIDAATKAAKDNGRTLNLNKEKGRANQQALNQLASATTQYTQSLIKSGASADKVVAANERGRESFIKTARDMGKTKAQAVALADSLFSLPPEIKSQVVVAGMKIGKKDAADLNKELKKIPKDQRAKIVTIAETKGAKAARAAMEAVKDKTVIAHSKGDLKGAKDVDAAMKALRDRLVKATARGDKKGATDVRKAMQDLRDRNVYARSHYDPSGVRAARSDLNSIDGKTATTYVKTVHVGGAKAQASATGGYITGPGTGTSDDIPAWLSNGEYVIRAAAVKAVGLSTLHAINAKGYSTGGSVSASGVRSPIPAGFDFNAVWRLVTAVTKPMAAIVAANAALVKAQAAKLKEDRDVAAARKKLASARSKKAKSAAQTALDKQLDEQKTAVEKLTDSQKNLADAQQQFADQARSASDSLSAPFRSTSSDIADWLDTMKQGAIDLKGFQTQIAQLRKLGVSETIVKEITDQGAQAGSELAGQIISGGKQLADALNKANGNLQNAADSIGFDVVSRVGRYATGGFVSGPGTATSDSINARLSTGEYVVNASSTALNRSVLDAINYGRSAAPRNYAQPGHFRYGGPVSAGLTSQAVADALARMSVLVENPWTGEYHAARMRAVAGGVYANEARRAEAAF